MPYTATQIQNMSASVARSRRWCDGRLTPDHYAIRNVVWTLRRMNEVELWEFERRFKAVRELVCDGCDEVYGFVDAEGEAHFKPGTDEVEIGYEHYCSVDCAAECGYHTCEYCGDWYHEDDEVYTGDYGYCSTECANEDGFHQCERCGDWSSDTFYVNVGSHVETWCCNCYDDHSTTCEGCCERVSDDGTYYDEESGCYYCRDCFEGEGGGEIHTYNYRPRTVFFGGEDEQCPLYEGVELETDSGDCRGPYARELDSIEGFPKHFYMKNDGSLCNGVELVSHPMTLAYHFGLMPMYESIGRTARKHGFVSHDSGNCGLHVSVNNSFFGKTGLAQDAGKYKLMRLFQRFEKQLTVFSRRTSDHWCHYSTCHDYRPKADKVDVRNGSGYDGERSLFAKSAEFVRYEQDKYRAVNICHPNHVEIRIFRGTLKWSTYFASLALVEGIARAAKRHGSTWVETVSWYDFVDEVVSNVSVDECRRYLVEYLDEKGLRQ